MVDGGDCIQEAQWKTVSNIIQKVMFISFLATTLDDIRDFPHLVWT